MIDFEEELKKFKPSLEVSSIEDAIAQSDMADVADIILDIIKKEETNKQ